MTSSSQYYLPRRTLFLHNESNEVVLYIDWVFRILSVAVGGVGETTYKFKLAISKLFHTLQTLHLVCKS